MKKKPKRKPVLGEPITFSLNKPHWIRCCDCRLAHLILIEPAGKDRVTIRFYLDEYETDKARKEK